MSDYNSTNTTVLETYNDHGNLRMLLFYKGEVRNEFIIGSYFTTNVELGDPYDKNSPAFIDHYSWDWGHYFTSIAEAADYWKHEVLGERN